MTKYLTVKVAAEALGMSRALLYALCQAKKIRHMRYGLGRGTIKIPPEALEEYRLSVTVEPEAAPPPKRGRHLS
jgi:excisionase family DNA binding protein